MIFDGRTRASRPIVPAVALIGAAWMAGCAEEGPVVPEGPPEAAGAEAAASLVPGAVEETADIIDQGEGTDGTILVEDGALLRRTPDGISAHVVMPTPEPGTYDYPEGTEPGRAESFTLWVFVFNDPSAELHEWDAAYGAAGHPLAGPRLTLSGHVSTETEPFTGEGTLEDPAEAKVLLRIAPHGAVDPERLPDQVQVPSGAPEHWWSALFD